MFNKIGKETTEKTKRFEKARKELSDAFKVAIGKRAIPNFAEACGVDVGYIANIVNEKIKVLPDRILFRDIEKASQKRVTYSHLCQICGYPEYDVDDQTLRNFYPKRGSVYYVDLGYNNLDSEQYGIRPCLIISNDAGNKNSGTLIVAPITAQIKKNLPCHVKISQREGMDRDSTICFEQMRTVTKRRMFYSRVPIKIMELSEEKIFEVNTAIEKQLGLIDCMFNENSAFELVEQIKELQKNVEVKRSRGLVDVLDSKIDSLVIYCKKYNRSIDRVIHEYERNENYVYAVS